MHRAASRQLRYKILLPTRFLAGMMWVWTWEDRHVPQVHSLKSQSRVRPVSSVVGCEGRSIFYPQTSRWIAPPARAQRESQHEAGGWSLALRHLPEFHLL